MVGVPGRSKGCNTCIKRKVKCDQETPQCGNCRRSQRLCTGYKRKLGYVFSQDVDRSGTLFSPSPSPEETTIIHHGRWRRSGATQISPAAEQSEERRPTPAFTPSSSSSSIPHISTSLALRQQLQYVFLNQQFPCEVLDPSGRDFFTNSNWMLQLQDIGIQSPALEASAAAFLAARVGRANADLNLALQSRSMYVKALDQLRRALANPKSRLSDETLAACMALSLYEITECPGGTLSSFSAHQDGALALLHLRGPSACASPLGHSLFVELRTRAIVRCLIFRQETFLSDPAWRVKPWTLQPQGPHDKLIDILFDLPAIFRQLDHISQKKDNILPQKKLQSIIKQFLNVKSALQVVYKEFDRSVSGPLYSPQLSTLESPTDDHVLGKVFPVSFHYSTFFVAQTVTTYWSAMMTVHHNLMFTYAKLLKIESEAQGTTSSSDDALNNTSYAMQYYEHAEEWKGFSRKICQSTEYFLDDKMRGLGPVTALVNLVGCLSCWTGSGEQDREVEWTRDLIQRIKRKVGLVQGNILIG